MNAWLSLCQFVNCLGLELYPPKASITKRKNQIATPIVTTTVGMHACNGGKGKVLHKETPEQFEKCLKAKGYTDVILLTRAHDRISTLMINAFILSKTEKGKSGLCE